MRHVSRGPKPAPASLSKRDKNGMTELDRVRQHLRAPVTPNKTRKAFPYAAYKADDVKLRLEGMFHGKCAYCESIYASQAPVDVEHYRPKGRVEGAPHHKGYWWLAATWANLLPSCIDCNRRRRQQTPVAVSDLGILAQTMKTGKQDAFPLAGTRADSETADLSGEQPLLLDPTRDDPNDHLKFYLGEDKGSGLVYPVGTGRPQPLQLPAVSEAQAVIAAAAARAGLSLKGAISIQVYGLNRLRLVQERAGVVRRMRFLEALLLDLGRIAANINQPHLTAHPEVVEAIQGLRALQARILTEMMAMADPDAPYSAIAAAYLADFRKRAAA